MNSDEWDKSLMVHDWPECGPGRLKIEELYQIFKKRLATEHDWWIKQDHDPTWTNQWDHDDTYDNTDPKSWK